MEPVQSSGIASVLWEVANNSKKYIAVKPGNNGQHHFRTVDLTASERMRLIFSRETINFCKVADALKSCETQMIAEVSVLTQPGKTKILDVVNKIFDDANVNKLKKFNEKIIDISNKTWMQDLSDEAKELHIDDFCLPGTHDSGSYQYMGYHTSRGPKYKLMDFMTKHMSWLNKTARQSTITQQRSIYGQLVQGVRLFDLRVLEKARTITT